MSGRLGKGKRVSVSVALLLLVVSAGQAGTVSGETGAEDEAIPGRAVGHRETPVAPPAVPVTRESQPRSPRAVVVRGEHRSVQVNVDAQQNNIVGDAANEPSLAIDPTDPNNVVVGWRQFDSIASDFRQAGMAYSHDGGASWTFPGPLQPGQFRSDPVLAADAAGDFYYYSLSSVTTTEYFVSTDKGVNWSGPTSSPGGDKNWHTIDVSGGIGDGHVYPIWNSQFTCCAAGTDFARSTDAAMSFDGPYVLPQHPKWGTDDVGPDGELYVVGATLNASGHLILRSDDARNAAATPSFALARGIDLGGVNVSGGAPNPGGLLGQVWVAVDRSIGSTRGNVYVLSSVDPPGADPSDVHFIRSEDGGQSWSAPLRVNDDATDNGAYQWFGTMSVAPDGRIDVVWNDTRSGPATMSELYYAYSVDAGATFSAGLAVSPAYDSTVGHPVQNKIGDYYHMVSGDRYAGVAWSATFNGEQDVYYLRVGDCNANGTHDAEDVSAATSPDVNVNGIPDECEPDCNVNGIPDAVDVSGGGSSDCDANGTPDECDIAAGASDCNEDGLLDACDVTFDLETDPGFTVGAAGDDATTGIWVRVDPVGTLAQPENDHTPGAGTMCFVTGQGTVGGTLGANDVDGGTTTLISPTLDLGGTSEPWIGYWRWYSNDTGAGANADTFVVDISNDGGAAWANVEIVGPAGPGTSGGWFFRFFRVSDIVAPTADVVLRFVASDLGTGSLVEAAIDDLVVVDCADCLAAAPSGVTGLRLGLSGSVAQLTWSPVAGATSYDIYRGAQRDATDLACFASAVPALSDPDDGLVPASGDALFYVTAAVNCAGESGLGFGRTPAVSCP